VLSFGHGDLGGRRLCGDECWDGFLNTPQNSSIDGLWRGVKSAIPSREFFDSLRKRHCIGFGVLYLFFMPELKPISAILPTKLKKARRPWTPIMGGASVRYREASRDKFKPGRLIAPLDRSVTSWMIDNRQNILTIWDLDAHLSRAVKRRHFRALCRTLGVNCSNALMCRRGYVDGSPRLASPAASVDL
jgi:hypothetical protein